MIVPDWWPRTHGSKDIVTQFWRAMRPDMLDLLFRFHPAHDLLPDDPILVEWALRAVGSGSHERSPFLHVSLSFVAACGFAAMARDTRNESDRTQIMVRIDLWDWYVAGGLTKDMVYRARDHHRSAIFAALI